MIRPAAFKIVTGSTPAAIEESVNQLIKDGWTFHGDLKVIIGSHAPYVQAMCKTEVVFAPGEQLPPGAGGGLLIPRG